MTETELYDRLEPLLNRHPFVPIRVDGDTGPILTIDNPYRVDLFEGELTILHKDEGRRPVAVVKAAQVTNLVPFDELPAETGCLSYTDFYAVARPLYHAKPFVPFTVELIDGTRYVSEKHQDIGFGGRLGVFHGGPGVGTKTFWVADVARVFALQPAEVA